MDFRKGRNRIDLCGGWFFAYSNGPVRDTIDSSNGLKSSGLPIYECAVPGNFELDLQANGIIGDPFYGMDIAELTKYEKSHVWYFRRFEAEDRDGFESELLFEGLDCYADIYLNGRQIGSCDNMLVEQSFDVTGLLEGDNELLVHIRPAVEEAKGYDYPPSLRAINYDSLYVRKAAHMFGWDIMPRAVSAGIWRPVGIVYKPRERLEHVYLETTRIAADRRSAGLVMNYHAITSSSRDDRYEISIEGQCGESRFSAEQEVLFDAGKLVFSVSDPRLWWPRGRGDANLYDVTVVLLKNGEKIDRMDFTHGIRSVELARTSVTNAEATGEFCFKINGEKVFVLGTNWVPADAYHSRDVERIPQILDMVEDIGCNMIRCWGGNVYENDLFYEICDRKGIMVWQDFSMACAFYPQDRDFQRRLEEEARKVVRRLRPHACVVLWAGDNECDTGLASSGRDPNRNVLTREVLPRVVGEEDFSTPYIPSSPYIDQEAFRSGASNLPEDHLWGPRDYYKGDFYRNSVCHFASEIGYHGCPSPDSMRKFISPEKLWPYTNNEEWLLHSTSPVPGVDMFDYRVELMAKQIRELFGQVPDNLDDFSLASQISQAEAKKFFIEMFRSSKWRRTGIIWWNLMDGWPQLSDAVVDYYFERKLAYHFIKRSQAPVCLMLREPASWAQELVAANDTREDVGLDYRVFDIDTNEALAEGHGLALADTTTVLAHIPFSASAKRFYIIEWKSPAGDGRNHYLAGYPPFDLETYREWFGRM